MAPRLPARPRRQLDRIVHAAAEIAMDGPTAADKAVLARQLVQTTLPHTDPGEAPV